MIELTYDLHLHSCLSPCGDDDMTPNNIVGMAKLKGLSVVALTDHNSAKNCPAFFIAAEKEGLIPIGGMELTTAEDIHMVALFPTLEKVMAFDRYLEGMRIRIPNRPDIFGHQQIMDENDQVIGEEPDLLINALLLDLESATDAVRSRGGICFPAHIDKTANSILTALGFLPQRPSFSVFEIHDTEKLPEYRERYLPENAKTVTSSDAHCLWDIMEGDEAECFLLPDGLYGDEARKRILESLL